jgi:hypothetical protein
MPAKASARKSLGEFKPLIVYPNGGTEVCEKSPERTDHYTRHGIVPGNRYARGTTYKTREEAIAAAQAVIDARRADAERRLALWTSQNHDGRLDKGIASVRQEIETWGG